MDSMQLNKQSSYREYLSEQQQQICDNAQQFVKATNTQIQQRLKNSKWEDMYRIITHPHIDNNIKIVCCSVMKWLVYHTPYINNPIQIFKQYLIYYLQILQPNTNTNNNTNINNSTNNNTNINNSNNNRLQKSQQMVQIVLKSIISQHLKQKQKWQIIQQLYKLLLIRVQESVRILKILSIIIQEIQIQTINNQVIVGQLLLFISIILQYNQQQPIQEQLQIRISNLNPYTKIHIISQSLKLIQQIIDAINNDDIVQENIVEQQLHNSKLAQSLLQQIINQQSGLKQIITNNKQLNTLKYTALELYTTIWIYNVQEFMFKLCLSSLLTRPIQLIDQQCDIMQKVIIILQRSTCVQAYYQFYHTNTQLIVFSLLGIMKPKQSYLQMIQHQPQQFVDILYDICMEQQRQMLQVRAASLLSNLCMYIDGYLSFVGSMCIMIIKQFNGSLKQLPGAQQYMNTIDQLWNASDEDKLAACVLVCACLSDQLEKREDLARPLSVELSNMTHMFQIQNCKLPPYLLCRFMFLYSYMGHPKYLQKFLPYKQLKQVYQYQLQSCYKILTRYHAKFPQYKPYVQSFGEHVILGNRLTPLLQNTILTGQLTYSLQFSILQKLVIWFDQGMDKGDRIVGNKIGNLIVSLIDRMVVDDYKQCQQAVYAYLQPLCRKIMTEQGQEAQQFLLQIIVSHVRRFANLNNQPQRLMYFLNIGFKIVQRNKGTLNSCLQLFYQLTKYLPYQLVCSLIQIYLGCLECQTREQDIWQCYYGLECCMLRICQLKQKVPSFNMGLIIERLKQYESDILKLRVGMFVYSVILAQPNSQYGYRKWLGSIGIITDVPVYQNKVYCYYLLHIVQYLQLAENQVYNILIFILQLIKRQQPSFNISKLIKQYQQQIYENMHKYHQVTINAYTISRKLIHPLLIKNIDIYYQFRQCWNNYPYKQYVMANIDQNTKKYLTELCTQQTVNHKVRKIYKVKNNISNNMNNINNNNDSQMRDTNQMRDGNQETKDRENQMN